MTEQEAKLIIELTEAISAATDGMLIISKTATETMHKITEALGKARDIVQLSL